MRAVNRQPMFPARGTRRASPLSIHTAHDHLEVLVVVVRGLNFLRGLVAGVAGASAMRERVRVTDRKARAGVAERGGELRVRVHVVIRSVIFVLAPALHDVHVRVIQAVVLHILEEPASQAMGSLVQKPCRSRKYVMLV